MDTRQLRTTSFCECPSLPRTTFPTSSPILVLPRNGACSRALRARRWSSWCDVSVSSTSVTASAWSLVWCAPTLPPEWVGCLRPLRMGPRRLREVIVSLVIFTERMKCFLSLPNASPGVPVCTTVPKGPGPEVGEADG